MHTSSSPVSIGRIVLLAVALVARLVFHAAPAPAQGPEPFGALPQGGYGAMPYGIVPPSRVMPLSASRPESWPGGPAKQKPVRPAVAVEPATEEDMDPGFSFAEDHGGPPRKPRAPATPDKSPPPQNGQPPKNPPETGNPPTGTRTPPDMQQPVAGAPPRAEEQRPAENRPVVETKPTPGNHWPLEQPAFNAQPRVEFQRPVERPPVASAQPAPETQPPLEQPTFGAPPRAEIQRPVENRPVAETKPAPGNHWPLEQPTFNAQARVEFQRPAERPPVASAQPAPETPPPLEQPAFGAQPRVEILRPVENPPVAETKPAPGNHWPLERPTFNAQPRVEFQRPVERPPVVSAQPAPETQPPLEQPTFGAPPRAEIQRPVENWPVAETKPAPGNHWPLEQPAFNAQARVEFRRPVENPPVAEMKPASVAQWPLSQPTVSVQPRVEIRHPAAEVVVSAPAKSEPLVRIGPETPRAGEAFAGDRPAAVRVPQLEPVRGAEGGTAPAQAAAAAPALSVPLLQNPYSLDARLRSAGTLRNPYVVGPPAETVQTPVADPVPVVVRPSEPVRVSPPAETPIGMLQNPFHQGLPGDRRPLSEQLSAGPACRVAVARAQAGQIRSGLVRNPFVEHPPGAAGSAVAGSGVPVTPPGVQVGSVVRNPHVSPAGEAIASDEIESPRAVQESQAGEVKSSPAELPRQRPANEPPPDRTRSPSAEPSASSSLGPGPAWMRPRPGPKNEVAARPPVTVATVAYVVESRAPEQGEETPKEMLLAQAAGPAHAPPGTTPAVAASPGVAMIPSGPSQAAGQVQHEPGMNLCEDAQILARVGSEVILAADVAGPVNEMLMLNKDKIPPEHFEMARQQLTRRLLAMRIETKLAYQDARRQLPAEAVTRVEKNISDAFDSEEIEKLMKRTGANSRHELDAKLQALGSSLELKRQAFIEQVLARQWVGQKVKVDGEVSHEQMLNYYREHIQEFETPAQARWEELEVRFSRHPRKEEAFGLIAQLGNRVLNGEPFAAVAKAGSEGITASGGGQRDWTSRGSLVSAELDAALFGLPVGALSQIIESKTGFHIIRIVERKDATRTPFVEAQVEIRKKIKNKGVDDQMKTYLEDLRKQVPIWTVFDDQPHPTGRG